MGLFKQIKEMKDMVHEAPGLIAQSTQLAEAAKANAAVQSAAAAQYAVPGASVTSTAAPSGAGTGAIAGVDLPLYATISRAFAEVGYDQAQGPALAARHGIGASQWQEAMDGWNARIASDPSVAAQFNALYTGR